MKQMSMYEAKDMQNGIFLKKEIKKNFCHEICDFKEAINSAMFAVFMIAKLENFL
jgi:hypothetical protein